MIASFNHLLTAQSTHLWHLKESDNAGLKEASCPSMFPVKELEFHLETLGLSVAERKTTQMRTEVNKTEKSTLERVNKREVVLRTTKKNDGQQQG